MKVKTDLVINALGEPEGVDHNHLFQFLITESGIAAAWKFFQLYAKDVWHNKTLYVDDI